MKKDAIISANELDFILSALKHEERVDGRNLFDQRQLELKFGREPGSVEVQLGRTRVLAVATGELVPPFPDRPNEGFLAVFTEFSPMADPNFEPGRPGDAAVELGRIIDRGLRESRAVDTEALCVVAARAVWSVRLDIHILDNGGNLVDAANTAALGALLSFRRPECTLGGPEGQDVVVFPPEVREPLPLNIHHVPVTFTFGIFGDGDVVVLDPNLKEEAAMGARLTLTVNTYGEVCSVQKAGGLGISQDQVMRCTRIALSRASDLTTTITGAVERHEAEVKRQKLQRPALYGVHPPSSHQVSQLKSTAVSESISESSSEDEGEPIELKKPSDRVPAKHLSAPSPLMLSNKDSNEGKEDGGKQVMTVVPKAEVIEMSPAPLAPQEETLLSAVKKKQKKRQKSVP